MQLSFKLKIITVVLAMFSSKTALSQDYLCICFNKETKNLKYNVSNDSLSASFSIVRPGFETKEKRDKAMEEYKKRGPVHYPKFSIGYIAGGLKKEKQLIDLNCALKLSVEKFRKMEFEYPVGVGSASVKFVYKKNESTFIVWNAHLMD
jgi:hypothetical protein